jgi:hypothetical protein
MRITTRLPATIGFETPTLADFRMSQPCDPLRIGTLILTPHQPVVPGVYGSVDPGNATIARPATHIFTMGDQFQDIVDFVNNCQGGFAFAITYDTETYAVYDCIAIDWPQPVVVVAFEAHA